MGKLIVHAVFGRGCLQRGIVEHLHGEHSQDIVDDHEEGDEFEDNWHDDGHSEDEVAEVLVEGGVDGPLRVRQQGLHQEAGVVDSDHADEGISVGGDLDKLQDEAREDHDAVDD